MKLIIGLGNPSESYVNTRHNVGHLFVDELKNHNLPNGVTLKKSDTFMNESGDFVKKMTDQYKLDLSDLFIVHDDLDIKLGEYKIQFGRGPKDHNGLGSVNDALGTDQYWHIRMGVDNRPLDNRPLGTEYVLQNFSDEEKEVLDKVIKEAVNDLIEKVRVQ